MPPSVITVVIKSVFAAHKCTHCLVSLSFTLKVDLLLSAFDGMNVDERAAPSIFECQLRLFTQWFGNWTDEERNHMVNKLEAIDAEAVALFYENIQHSKCIS